MGVPVDTLEEFFLTALLCLRYIDDVLCFRDKSLVLALEVPVCDLPYNTVHAGNSLQTSVLWLSVHNRAKQSISG